MTIGWHFDNTYSKLSDTFKEEIKPVPVKNPELVILNEQLAKELDLNFSNISQEDLSKLFSGNILPKLERFSNNWKMFQNLDIL